jgi:hypothetical protein
LIDTILEYPTEFDKECKKQVYRTLEMNFPGDIWEVIWDELINVEETYTYIMDDFENGVATEVTETYGNDGAVRIETNGDLAYLVIEITHDEFITDGMAMFETSNSTIQIEAALVYRNAEGAEIEQLTQYFTLFVENPRVETELVGCSSVQLTKMYAGAQYD